MPERVDLPADARSTAFAECVVEEAMAPCELVDDALVVRRGFVIHAPRAANELESALVDEHLHLLAELVVLLGPPLCEKR